MDGWRKCVAQCTGRSKVIQLVIEELAKVEESVKITEYLYCQAIFIGVMNIHRVPPVGQNLWFMFDSADDVTTLLDGLHPLGVRESALKEALKKHVDSLLSRLRISSPK